MKTAAAKTNKKIIEQCYADFGSGNVEGLLSALHEDVVWIDPGFLGILYKGRRKGKEQVREFFGNLSAALNITRFDVQCVSESGNKVFVEGYIEASTNGSGLKTQSDWAMVWQLKNRQVIYHHLYLDTNALALAVQNRDNQS